MPSFPTERARLKVRNPSGDVQVETADVAETTVELVPLNDSDATRQAIEKANVGARGDEVFVELEGRSWSISIGSWGVGSAKVSVRISCPRRAPTWSATPPPPTSGSPARSVRCGSGRRRATSGSTACRVHSRRRPPAATSGSSTSTVRASMNTVSGDVGLNTAMGGLAVNSVSGDVVLGEVFGDLTAGTVSGDLMVRAAGPGEVGLKAVSGDVVVAMRRGLRVRLDVSSVSGSVGSELDVSDTPSASDGPEANLRVRTVSGDVRITRAAEAVA